MFTIFLAATAAAVCAVLVGLLLRPHKGAKELRLPYAGISVAAIALGLMALGVWMV